MLNLKTILVRKPENYDQVLEEQKQMIQDLNTHVEEYEINSVVELSHDEFENFKNTLLDDRDFILEHDDVFLVKEKDADIYSGLIVDPQGFGYARYVGIPMQEVDIKKCPNCSSYYFGHPAISRKDNKTEICPACGVEEALKEFGFDVELIKFLGELQFSSDKFDAKIIIQREGKEDIVIEPKN